MTVIDGIKKLQGLYALFNKKHDFKIGDIVEYKPGFQTKMSSGPFVVMEILENPILITEQGPGTPYFREPLDIILGEIAENQFGEVLIAMHYDSRRFQPYGYSEKENIQKH